MDNAPTFSRYLHCLCKFSASPRSEVLLVLAGYNCTLVTTSFCCCKLQQGEEPMNPKQHCFHCSTVSALSMDKLPGAVADEVQQWAHKEESLVASPLKYRT